MRKYSTYKSIYNAKQISNFIENNSKKQLDRKVDYEYKYAEE